MTKQDYHIIPYNETYEAKAFALETGIVQGNKIQLEIIKDHFLDRAKIFSDHFCCLAVTENEEVIGSAMGAKNDVGDQRPGGCDGGGIRYKGASLPTR